jgi:hypothetical protein
LGPWHFSCRGYDVEIRNNRIARTPSGAGILIHSETSYKTTSLAQRDRRIQPNSRCADAKTRLQRGQARWKKTGHGAIDVFGQGTREVNHVYISKNFIDDADRDGIFVRGNSCGIDIVGDHAQGVGRDAIRTEIGARPACRIGCRGNSANAGVRSDARCTGEVKVSQ